MSNTRDWVQWIRILHDPNEAVRGFSLENLEFQTKTAEAVEDEMYGTLPGDANTQRGKFWIVAENELMRRCPQMQAFAQGEDWFFPVEFCDAFIRPYGVEPVVTRDATDKERMEAFRTFENVKTKISE